MVTLIDPNTRNRAIKNAALTVAAVCTRGGSDTELDRANKWLHDVLHAVTFDQIKESYCYNGIIELWRAYVKEDEIYGDTD